jgi:hypothetical protein
MKDLTWIDDLKLRGGWGQTGNQSGIGDYAYLQRYNIGRIEWFKKGGEGDSTDYANAVPTISQANLRTSDLTWETTTQTNIGLDLTILNGRLTFNADYYYKKTKNMLMNVSLPAGAAAATSIARNEGEMVNKGFELSISSKNLRGGAFTWDTDFNISFNRNKLTKLELQKVYYDAKTADVVNDYVVRNEPGRALGGFYGYISDGVDPETGELMYRDLNNDGKISSSDRTYIGDPNPDFTYGMTNTFSWKGFNLSALWRLQRIYSSGVLTGKHLIVTHYTSGSVWRDSRTRTVFRNSQDFSLIRNKRLYATVFSGLYSHKFQFHRRIIIVIISTGSHQEKQSPQPNNM